jgi:hypothetical protein
MYTYFLSSDLIFSRHLYCFQIFVCVSLMINTKNRLGLNLSDVLDLRLFLLCLYICWLNVSLCSYFFSYILQLGWSSKLQNMFKNTFQSGFLSILYNLGHKGWWSYISFCCFVATLDNQDISCIKPLQIWDKEGASIFMLDLFNLLSYVVNTHPFVPDAFF